MNVIEEIISILFGVYGMCVVVVFVVFYVLLDFIVIY